MRSRIPFSFFRYRAQRHKGLPALVTLLLFAWSGTATAGGGWVPEPGEGSIRIGYNWKTQSDAMRRDIEGELYKALSSMNLDYRFLYLSGEVGVYRGVELSALVTYLWADETVDSTSEDPSRHYHGPSDMWVGLKYQLWGGDYPTAVSANVRLPYLYEASSTRNGHLLTEIPGLMMRDYEIWASVSRSFDPTFYASFNSGFRIKEGAATNQILLSSDAGGSFPVAGTKVGAKIGVNCMFSVGEPEPSTSKDRFSGLTLETDNHFFDFNDASFIQPQVGVWVDLLPNVNLSAGYAFLAWGHSMVEHHDVVVQLGYSF